MIHYSFAIKPESVTPTLNTKDWPLLLKNYDKLLVRSEYPMACTLTLSSSLTVSPAGAHFTPIPAGSSPLKRDLAAYIKCVLRFSCSCLARSAFVQR